MSEPLREYALVHATDVHLYELTPLPGEHDPRDSEFRASPLTTASFGIDRVDFFNDEAVWPSPQRGWIVANPPFVPAARMLPKCSRSYRLLRQSIPWCPAGPIPFSYCPTGMSRAKEYD